MYREAYDKDWLNPIASLTAQQTEAAHAAAFRSLMGAWHDHRP
jgi:hypothetical protein